MKKQKRSGLTDSSRVRKQRIRTGVSFGFSRAQVPLYPAGYVVVWTLDLGKVRYVWGEVN